MEMKKLKLVLSEDGSHTLFSQTVYEHYHSTFGAMQESKHVFILTGLDYAGQNSSSINLLEVGFGTGLNALLAMQWAIVHKIPIKYTGLEAYPISREMVEELNYPELLNLDKDIFLKMHFDSAERIELSNFFSIQLLIDRIKEIKLPEEYFDVVFFDAFSPDVQPEMWSEEIFQKLATAMKSGGVLTTYSTKGTVKRALKKINFKVEKLAGPKGKREILRAQKI